MKKKWLISGIYLFIIPVFLWSQDEWRNIYTVEDVCLAYPEKISFIFENLDLDYKGLEKVKKAWKANKLPKACSLLLEYYRGSAAAYSFYKEQPKISKRTTPVADSILLDIFTFQRVAGKVPRLPDGHLDWFFQGPENDIEWAWALNRHYPADRLLSDYYLTGNPAYIKYIDDFVKDWIIKSWPYPAVKSSTAMWRGLEVSFRVKTWARIFFELSENKFISPATRLLILSSLPDHAHYARNFHAQNNWLTMEISGLATVAAFWPEFRPSSGWIEYAKDTMIESMKDQVYPDGVQTELSSSYHFVSLSNFMLFNDICKKAGIILPEYYSETMEEMWNYLAYTMRPDGYGLLNNDSDRNSNRNRILNAAKEYNRPDWEFIASNGNSGIKPSNGLSVFFPWAGQLISRSGYDKDAHWSFFDIGPWGSGHQHNDKLHISVSAYGNDLLVDGGRFAYRGEVAQKFRSYAVGSQSHNVILIDGKGQAPGPRLADRAISENYWLINEQYDYARGSFDKFIDLEGSCEHIRKFFYSRGNFWVIVDQIITDRPRKIEALWHWHPRCHVFAEGQKVYTKNERGNLQIIPAGYTNWNVNLVKGQEEPWIQGWYSEEYNKFEPGVTAIYSTDIKLDNKFIWILFPSEQFMRPVNAEIISDTENELKLRIFNQINEEWFVTIPN